MAVGIAFDVFGTGFDGGFQHFVCAGDMGWVADHTEALEQEAYGFVSPSVPPCLAKAERILDAVRLRLSVSASMITATPAGP